MRSRASKTRKSIVRRRKELTVTAPKRRTKTFAFVPESVKKILLRKKREKKKKKKKKKKNTFGSVKQFNCFLQENQTKEKGQKNHNGLINNSESLSVLSNFVIVRLNTARTDRLLFRLKRKKLRVVHEEKRSKKIPLK